jgi:N-acetylneuraminic acid mutarotase
MNRHIRRPSAALSRYAILAFSPAFVFAVAPALVAALGAWTSQTNAPQPLGEVSVATVNGVEYMAGGSSATGAVNTLYAFDPAAGMWQSRAPFPGAGRDHMGLVAAAGYLYIAGGLSGLPGPSVTTFQRYDPASNSWTTLAPLPTTREPIRGRRLRRCRHRAIT